MSDRLARLQARTALESATARRLVFNLLLVSGYGLGEARTLNDAAWQKAVESLKRRLEAVQAQQGPSESATPGAQRGGATGGGRGGEPSERVRDPRQG